MCGRNSRWLGPKRRLKEFGSENGGTRRSTGSVHPEQKGYYRGAKVGGK